MYDNDTKVGKLNYSEFYAVYELKVDSNKFKCDGSPEVTIKPLYKRKYL